MKHLIYLFIISLMVISCQPEQSLVQEIDHSRFPENLVKVLEAHGGLERWSDLQGMQFERVNSAGNEVHTINLKSRLDKIEAPNFKMGYDGSKYWVEADTSFKRDPIFYHNLMFYFYAMPFVLADEGIVYTETAPLVYDSIAYPGVKMAFNDGVGSSPKDDYIIYYNAETFQMEWLAYTATYFTQEKKSTFSYIRYPKWAETGGVVLPTSLTWYRTGEDNRPSETRNTVNFEKIQVQEEAYPDESFLAPPGARVAEE